MAQRVSYLVSGAAALLYRWLGMIERHPMEMPVVAFAMEDSGEISFFCWIGVVCRIVMIIESTWNYIHVGDGRCLDRAFLTEERPCPVLP
jgi:hypothetical protein